MNHQIFGTIYKVKASNHSSFDM